MKLKAIFLDIDDTLYSTSEFAEMARHNSIKALVKLGVKMSEEKLERELNEVIEEFSSNHDGHYDKLLLRIPPVRWQGLNPAVLVAGAVVAYHDTKFRHLKPYEDVVEALKILSHNDIILGVITAGLTVKQAEKLVRLNILQYIQQNAIFISDQIGVNKPNEKLYLRALNDLNLAPQETMYIGDNPLADIDPPNNIGMITVHNRRSGKHSEITGKTKANYEIHNFFDLLDILNDDFGIKTHRQ